MKIQLLCNDKILTEIHSVCTCCDWIPCVKQMPIKADNYIVTFKNLSGETEVCECFFSDQGDFFLECEGEVIAWLPMLEPFKEAL